MEKSTKKILSYDHGLFMTLDSCKDALIDLEIVPETRQCVKCGSETILKIYKEGKKYRSILYTCSNGQCRYRQRILEGINIPLKRYLFLLYCIYYRFSYLQIYDIMGCSNDTIAKAKRVLRRMWMERNVNRLIIGEPGIVVQADETVLCRRGHIRSPTSSEDECRTLSGF
ncbi:hypothetical protein NGRA_2362 [Nosema granulosis]|uniref:Transposase n=1 Tax=Nosema granulosis TaxID=83296 RepID=A0A9P6GXM8_9MICR|nr:hypothetical protein NGRA_2362 [Nosema granulosis]